VTPAIGRYPSGMNGRIIVISDTHFGRSHAAAAGAQSLRPIWQGANHLIVNGDVAEVHNPHHWSLAARQTLELYDLCEKDETQLTLLSGNHDPYISDIRHLRLANEQIFITHGDVLHPAIAPWSPAAGRIRAAFDEAMSKLRPEDRDGLEHRLDASQHASHAEWGELERQAGQSRVTAMMIRPWAMAKVLWYWHSVPKLAAAFAKKHVPLARFFIFGHTHRPGIWTDDGLTIINTGSFGFPGTPRAVVVEHDELAVHRIVWSGGEYKLRPRPIARFALDAVEEPAATNAAAASTR
jgi:predicted phosphodiesterase